MIKVEHTLNRISFKAHHLKKLELQPHQQKFKTLLNTSTLKHLENEHSFTVFNEDMVVLACYGISKIWEGRYCGWTFLSKHASKYMLNITRIFRDYFDKFNDERVELYVDSTYEKGQRWAVMLGFEEECFLPKFFQKLPIEYNRDAIQYVRLKGVN